MRDHAKLLAGMDSDRLIALVDDEAARLRPDRPVRREDRAIQSSFLAIQGRFDGSASLYGEADAISAATIVDALDAVADLPVHPDAGITRAQQRFGALVHICERTLAGESAELRPRPRVLARIDVAALDDAGRDDALRLLWSLRGRSPRLSSVARDELLCDATVVPVLFDGPRPIAVGDQSNVFSDKTRSAIVARDGRCRFCGDAPAAWCDVHHLVPGHGNTADDGCLLCRRCHRTVHRYGWTISWCEDGALEFKRRNKSFVSHPP